MMNLVAPTDGLLFFFLMAIIFRLNYILVLCYFFVNLLMSIVALKGILKEE